MLIIQNRLSRYISPSYLASPLQIFNNNIIIFMLFANLIIRSNPWYWMGYTLIQIFKGWLTTPAQLKKKKICFFPISLHSEPSGLKQQWSFCQHLYCFSQQVDTQTIPPIFRQTVLELQPWILVGLVPIKTDKKMCL